MPVLMTVFLDGTGIEMLSMPEALPEDIFLLSFMSTRLNWLITAVGFMSSLMGMSGYLMFIMQIGGRIITEDGAGILLSGGLGCLMIHGDGVFIIMEDGTGD